MDELRKKSSFTSNLVRAVDVKNSLRFLRKLQPLVVLVLGSNYPHKVQNFPQSEGNICEYGKFDPSIQFVEQKIYRIANYDYYEKRYQQAAMNEMRTHHMHRHIN